MPSSLRALSFTAILLSAAPAVAQIDEGREALAAAEFTRAIEAFDEAERGPLSRDEYVAVLEGRALASWASGDEARARADLAALAEIDPQHAFPIEAPPDIAELFAEALAARAGPLDARAAFSAEGDRLTVTVDNDDAALVERVRAHVRSRGEPWLVAEASAADATFSLPRGTGTGVQAWVELLGPGGAVLATAGSEVAPISWEPPPTATRTRVPERRVSVDPRTTEDDASIPWVALGVGAGVVVIVTAIVLAVAVSGGGVDGAQPTAPMVMGF